MVPTLANITAGNWTMEVFVGEGASDDQVKAVERILSGQEGGPFAEFAPLISDFKGITRASVSFSDGDKASASIAGVGDLSIDAFMGGDGTPTTVKNAMFGFAQEFRVGRSSGKADILGKTVDLRYAESAEFVYSSEAGSDVHVRA